MSKIFSKVEFQSNSNTEVKIKGEIVSDNIHDGFYVELMNITGQTQENQRLSLPRIRLDDINDYATLVNWFERQLSFKVIFPFLDLTKDKDMPSQCLKFSIAWFTNEPQIIDQGVGEISCYCKADRAYNQNACIIAPY